MVGTETSQLHPMLRQALQEEASRLRRTLQSMGTRLPDGGARIRTRLAAIDEELQAIDAPPQAIDAPPQAAGDSSGTQRVVVDLCGSDAEDVSENDASIGSKNHRVHRLPGGSDQAHGVQDDCPGADGSEQAPSEGPSQGCEGKRLLGVKVYDTEGRAHAVPLPPVDVLTPAAAASRVVDRCGREVVALSDTDGWHDNVVQFAELEQDYKHWKRYVAYLLQYSQWKWFARRLLLAEGKVVQKKLDEVRGLHQPLLTVTCCCCRGYAWTTRRLLRMTSWLHCGSARRRGCM